MAIYVLSKHAYLLYARPSGSRWRVGLGRSALNNPHFGQLLYNLLNY